MVANKPGRQGERGVSRKAIAQGMSDRLRCPVCSCAILLFLLHARPWDAARIRHSLLPRLRWFPAQPGRIGAAGRWRCVWLMHFVVVPAHAGTHNHRPWLLHESRQTASFKTAAAAYGSRLKAGTTAWSFRGGAAAPDPQSQGSGFDARPGMRNGK